MSLKQNILEMLEKNRGIYLSGQDLSEKLGVSRNGVWKAVNQLKIDGHDIESVPKLGHKLSCGSNVLTAEGIRAYMPNDGQNVEIIALESTNSTNNEAKKLISEGSDGYILITADEQSMGKGRLGRSFFSPAGSIYMSLAFKIDTEISDAIRLTTAASVAVVRAIESLTTAKPLIKWVNDIYIDGKKISGILTEGVTDIESGRVTHMIIGIGINCGTAKFPEELRDIATSLELGDVSRGQMIATIAAKLIDCIEKKVDFMDEYRQKSLVLGKKINYYKNGEATAATAIAIDDNGGLIVKHEDGSETCLNTGEISVRTC